MADTCGDKDLIRAAGGQTFDRPCSGVFGVTLYCNLEDYDDWRIRLEELGEQLLVTWNRLLAIENEKQEWSKSRAITDWYNRIIGRIEALPDASVWGPVANINPFAEESPAKVIAMMVGIATDIVCLLEVMRKAITGYGEKVPPVPHVKPEKKPQIDPVGAAKDIIKEAGDAAKKAGDALTVPLVVIGSVAVITLIMKPALTKRLAGGKS